MLKLLLYQNKETQNTTAFLCITKLDEKTFNEKLKNFKKKYPNKDIKEIVEKLEDSGLLTLLDFDVIIISE